MQDKKSGGRRAYLRDFQRDVTGAYAYTGKHTVYTRENALPFRRWFARLCVWNAVSVASAAVGGFLPLEGLKNCAYIILPLVFELASTVWALYGVISSGGHDRLRIYAYERSLKHLGVVNTLAAVCALIGAAGCVLFACLRGHGEPFVWPILYVLLRLIGGGGQLLSIRDLKNARWEEERRQSPDSDGDSLSGTE